MDIESITVMVVVEAPVERVWRAFTTAEEIVQWNQASEDWHTPRAENDLTPGGRFRYRMESRDGSSGFDFSGAYDSVEINERIEYTMEDGRKVSVRFFPVKDVTLVVETFDAERIHSLDQQRDGWQAILDHFKKYVETLPAGSDSNRMIRAITPCLWFDHGAEEAAEFYVSVFPHSRIEMISHYTKEGFEIHGQKEGAVMTVEFRLNGQPFTALNGGPVFTFNEAVSFQVFCDTQEEIDFYWFRLSQGGEEGPCGWLKDRYGVSWQIVPSILAELMSDPARAGRVTKAFMQMKKMDIEILKQA